MSTPRTLLPQHDKYNVRWFLRVPTDTVNDRLRSEMRNRMRQYIADFLVREDTGRLIEHKPDGWTTLFEIDLFVLSPDEFYTAVHRCAQEYLYLKELKDQT